MKRVVRWVFRGLVALFALLTLVACALHVTHSDGDAEVAAPAGDALRIAYSKSLGSPSLPATTSSATPVSRSMMPETVALGSSPIAPSTPPSAQLGTSPGGGGSG